MSPETTKREKDMGVRSNAMQETSKFSVSRFSRRTAFQIAAATAFSGSSAVGATSAAAQTPEATPTAKGPVDKMGEPLRGGTLQMVRPGASIGDFNPAAFAQDQQIPLSYLESLVRPDPITLEPTPWLAETWAWRKDGLQLALNLREGIVWHDGTPLEAADAQFSFNVYREDTESAVTNLFGLVESVEAVSEREVLVNFSERDGGWLFNVATLPIFSRRQYEAYWNEGIGAGQSLSQFDWATSMPLGTGPWRITEWDDDSIEFARFEDYWGTAPWLDTLRVAVKDGAEERFEAWEADDSEILWPVSVALATNADAPSDSLVVAPAASVMFAAFNFFNPNQPNGSLWTDLNVRKAVSLAIDRDRYAEEVFGGRIRQNAVGTVAQPWAHDESLMSPAGNRDAAAVLLAEAGWTDYNGDGALEDAAGIPFRSVAIVRQDSSAELISTLARVGRDLAIVGIELVLEALPAEEFDDRWINTRDYDLIAYAYDLLPGFTDFDLYGSAWDIRTNAAGWNPGGYGNPEADEAIADFLGAVSIERQKSALTRLQRAVNDDLFGIWLGFPDDLVLVSDALRGFEPDMMWQTAQTWKLWKPEQSG